MRYIAIDDSLALLAASGKAKYTFKNGVLQIGTATGTGAGNEIVPDLTGANYAGKYTLVLPSQVPSLDLTDFPLGFVIKATAAITVPAGDATWALALQPRWLDDQEHNLRSEHFIVNELTTFKDESSWNGKTYSSRIKDPKYVR